MHKKLEGDLISLAHQILQMKNKNDVLALKEKTQKIYEKLSVLAEIEEYLATSPQATETKETLISQFENTLKIEENVILEDEKSVEIALTETAEKTIKTPITEEQPFDELEQTIHGNITETAKKIEKSIEIPTQPTLEEELQDTVPVDVVANLFEKSGVKSLNDKLHKNIQIGLNDRIAFVKNLFEGSQEDFNRVVSQLNTFKSEKEAKKFINKMVKPDYRWSNHEELEARFLDIIERKFA